MSYGSRSELVNACQSIVTEALSQERISNATYGNSNDENDTIIRNNDNNRNKKTAKQTAIGTKITEETVAQHLMLPEPYPDILLRTSGEIRISNFLLWQCAYSEMFFINKHWPAITKEDLVGVIQQYASKRNRRFGK